MEVEEIGRLPTLPPLPTGTVITLEMAGCPPSKTLGRSMRNARSPERARFRALREAAISAMDGHKWHEGAVDIDLTYRSPTPPGLLDNSYLSGVMDTLGGSHGPSFIFLPIVYLDDCQTGSCTVRAEVAATESYRLELTLS